MKKSGLLVLIIFLIVFMAGCGSSHITTNTSRPSVPENQQTVPGAKALDPTIIDKYHISVSNQSFPPYPTEKQLFAQPDGKITFNGIQADSFGQGMEITWKDNNWEYFAIGHEPGDGERVAKEFLMRLPKGKTLVSGAIAGKLLVENMGNPTNYTVSWTYDGSTWYTIEDRKAITILQSIK